MRPPSKSTFSRSLRFFHNGGLTSSRQGSIRIAGFTIRSSVDCHDRRIAMEHNCAILHRDHDSQAIAEACGLKVYTE